MSFDWRTLPELRGASYLDALDRPVDYPNHLGDLAGELRAASNGEPLLVPLADRAWVSCSGPDARSFLHNQLTSDINHLKPANWQHSSWCTAKGRMLASFLAVESSPTNDGIDARFELQLAAELVPAIAKRLTMYVLRSKVKVEVMSGVSLGLAASAGQLATIAGACNLPCPDVGGVEAIDGGHVCRLNSTLLMITLPSDRVTEVFSSLSKQARPAGLSAWHWLEIQAGMPMIRLATQEEFVPQMVNFDKLGGVSFHKGCYPGQEIVARTQYLGKVKRHLYRVHADTPLIAGTPLHVTDAEGTHSAGLIANAAASPDGGFDALAVILESATESTIHANRPDGPPLSSIALVAA